MHLVRGKSTLSPVYSRGSDEGGQMKDLRKRADEIALRYACDIEDEDTFQELIDQIESFALEIRNEALGHAVMVLDDHAQGVLEWVNSGGMTMAEVIPKLKELASIQRDIQALMKDPTAPEAQEKTK